ncbi:MAG TPA: TaqI-like C-terminal specificity domain-containing protein [Chitinophagaceae bacterium]|nr:TaqI-like C-terminal specificity domain-containing protein [Chitinophagaceae bacterium]
MEGETSSSITAELRFGERVLPTLDGNIKSGNSLVDLDFYDGEIDFEPGAEKKIKPFSWQAAFPAVFAAGGFDAVIGNPPYVRQESLGIQKNYFAKKYNVYHGMADLYSYFFEKGMGLLKGKGLFGIIVANKWMRAAYGEPLRKWLKKQTLLEISDFGDLPVFQGATTYPCIVIAAPNQTFSKPHITATKIDTLDFQSLAEYIQKHKKDVAIESLEDEGWNLGSEADHELLKKLQSTGMPLGKYVNGKIYRGVLTGLNEAFVIDETTKNTLIKEDARSAQIIKPFLAGRDIKRYQPLATDTYLILFEKGFTNKNGNNPSNAWKWLEENYTAIAKHLKPFEEKGIKRFDKGEYWWELRACDYYDEFEKPKIIYPNICKQPEFTYDVDGWYTNQKCFVISLDDKYLLGILNSKIDYLLFDRFLPKLRGGFYEPNYVFFKSFPIKKIDFSNKEEKQLHDEIVKLVDTMLSLNKEKQQTTLPEKLEALQHRIQHTDVKLNKLVYQLYNLTPEENALVENT